MKLDKLDLATKYDLYIQAVQSPETDVRFYRKIYRQARGATKKNLILREDFCGTGIISTEWVKLDKKFRAIGVDLDSEPMKYGQEKFINSLSSDQQKRVRLVQQNVLDRKPPRADVVVAVNFSYCLFRRREQLKKYFKNVYDTLDSKGVFVIDVFGGTQCTDEIMDRARHKKFTYYWDQKNFDPVTSFADFAIHFRYKNKFYKDVFTYEWRIWSIMELREIMFEVGFKRSDVYWEGTNRQGGGNGIFSKIQQGEACMSWIAYVAGIK